MEAGVLFSHGCLHRLRDDGTLHGHRPSPQAGDLVALGRSEDGSDGIYVHTDGFADPCRVQWREVLVPSGPQPRNRLHATTTTSSSCAEMRSDHGFVEWVMGPAFAFDADSRHAMQRLVEEGYVDALSGGNALAPRDSPEGAMFPHRAWPGHSHAAEHAKRSLQPLGYHQPRAAVRSDASRSLLMTMRARRHHVRVREEERPFLLAGSIRDDGPLPETIADVYESQRRFAYFSRKATTVICMAISCCTRLRPATSLPAIPSTTMAPYGPVFHLYAVDASEFVVNKLHDRGPLGKTDRHQRAGLHLHRGQRALGDHLVRQGDSPFVSLGISRCSRSETKDCPSVSLWTRVTLGQWQARREITTHTVQYFTRRELVLTV